MKAVSPLISMVILIVIVIGIASLVGPWALTLVYETVNQTGSGVEQTVLCRQLGYDFDSTSGVESDGIEYSIGPGSDSLAVEIRNTGLINVYGFYFELEVNNSGETELYILYPTSKTQITADESLQPGESVRLIADFMIDGELLDITGSLTRLKVLNGLNCLPISKTFEN